MKDIVDYVQGIYGLLKKVWPETVAWDKDYDHIKDTDRPCYVVEVEDMEDQYLTNAYLAQSASVQIYYFAPLREKGYAELLKRKKALSKELLRPIRLEDFAITATAVEYEIDRDDMVLTAMFEIYTIQDETAEREEALDAMEELYLNRRNDYGTGNAND